jgi:WhiB family transcriptional regulator, redox-sensing transcriptional regulator
MNGPADAPNDIHTAPNERAGHDPMVAKERVATRLTARTVKRDDGETGYRESMSSDRFLWLNDTACADLTINHFFVEAGHAISDDTLNVCRGCPVRQQCLDHAYQMGISGGYFGGMSPGQRRNYSLEQARRYILSDPVRRR